MTNYEQEAQELYPDIPAYNKAFTLTERAAHIKARQMSEQEIRELREENDRLKGLIETAHTKGWNDGVGEKVTFAETSWEQFKQQNNIS